MARASAPIVTAPATAPPTAYAVGSVLFSGTTCSIPGTMLLIAPPILSMKIVSADSGILRF